MVVSSVDLAKKCQGYHAVYTGIKKPLMQASGVFKASDLFGDLNFVSLHAFLTLNSDKADFLAFFQALEAVALDRAEMHEQIRTAFWSDKTKTFFVVKPLDGTVLTIRHFCISLKLKLMTASTRGEGLILVARTNAASSGM
jgi:hypothetical protein